MAKYTTTLRTFCENLWVQQGNDLNGVSHDTVIKNALSAVFNFDFPIWDSKYRETLESKIVRHYYVEEIAFETFGLFQFYLENYLIEKMPYYNLLYENGVKMGNIFATHETGSKHFLSDDTHTTDNTGTQENSGTVDNTGTQTNTGITEHTGTQEKSENETNLEWLSSRDVGTGVDYQNDSQVSSARKTDGSIDTSSTRTDNLKDEKTATRTDNLKREDSFTRTDNLKETLVRNDDQWTTDDRWKDVPDKISTYGKLVEYYQDLDQQIIRALEPLFIGIW